MTFPFRPLLSLTLVAILILAPLAPTTLAVTPGASIPDGTFVEITPRMKVGVDRALAYLAAQQQPDGSFGIERYGRHVGISALACLAFMSHGDLPGRGKYGPVVERGLEFILDNVQPNGLVAADTSHGPMYGHGFATLFLAEIYGQTNDSRTREALVKAIRLIVQSQNEEGGWRYQPIPNEADVSVTICQVMGLRGARNAGVKVPKETIDKAVAYVRKCQNPDGGFRYMLNSGNSAFPRSAAGVATLWYAGVPADDEDVVRGLNYIMQHLPGGAAKTPHYYYGHYYGVQACYMAGPDYWRVWFPAIRDELLDTQDNVDGYWDGQPGKSYCTAMALIILQIPNRYLPIFQK